MAPERPLKRGVVVAEILDFPGWRVSPRVVYFFHVAHPKTTLASFPFRGFWSPYVLRVSALHPGALARDIWPL